MSAAAISAIPAVPASFNNKAINIWELLPPFPSPSKYKFPLLVLYKNL